MNKSLATNLLAGAVSIVAFLLPEGTARDLLLSAGLFSLSGALTNWLAIHMLFERVPLLYGSGIVPNRFGQFKAGIRALIMDNFFTEENFLRLTETASEEIDLEGLAEKISYSDLFDGMVEAVKASPLGGMLGMMGGDSMLEKFREPFEAQMKKRIGKVLAKSNLKKVLVEGMGHAGLRDKVARLVDARLAELTPQMVKEIVQKMIRTHLGWLVVWGGVFGALMGLLSALIV